MFVSVSAFANTDRTSQKSNVLPRDEIFPPADGKIPPLKGKIVDGRYHAPKNVFSCQACDFGKGVYTVQDCLFEQAACVGFYSSMGHFKKAEIIFLPGDKTLSEEGLKEAFKLFGIGILKTVDSAEGIKILKEEMDGDNMFFASISVDKMSVLTAPNGEYMASTRLYLVFQEKDKLVVLSNQRVTLPGQVHDPKLHVKKLKKDILDFRETFKFGLTPTRVNE